MSYNNNNNNNNNNNKNKIIIITTMQQQQMERFFFPFGQISIIKMLLLFGLFYSVYFIEANNLAIW